MYYTFKKTGIMTFLGMMLCSILVSSSAKAQYATPYNYSYIYVHPFYQSQAYWNMMQAQANYSYSSAIAEQEWALAQLQWQHANRAFMENEKIRVNTYWEMKQTIKDNVEKHATKAFVGEARVRAIQAKQPKLLDANQIDTVNGRITWPKELCVSKFASQCEKIEQAFSERSRAGMAEQVTIEKKIAELCKGLRQMLKEDSKSMKSDRFVECVKFIESLDHETTRPVAPRAHLASR